jgi:uncharacterized RDD family membrane protein YckC
MVMKACPRCGLSIGQTVLICPRCGEHIIQGTQGTSSFSPNPASALPVHAGFWIRAVAFLIDLIVVHLIAAPLMLILPIYSNLLVWWLYSALLESSPWQATVGKRVLRLKVTDVNGVRLFFGRASARFFAKFLSTSLLGIGFLMVAWTKNKQGLHDMVSGSLLYYRRA